MTVAFILAVEIQQSIRLALGLFQAAGPTSLHPEQYAARHTSGLLNLRCFLGLLGSGSVVLISTMRDQAAALWSTIPVCLRISVLTYCCMLKRLRPSAGVAGVYMKLSSLDAAQPNIGS